MTMESSWSPALLHESLLVWGNKDIDLECQEFRYEGWYKFRVSLKVAILD